MAVQPTVMVWLVAKLMRKPVTALSVIQGVSSLAGCDGTSRKTWKLASLIGMSKVTSAVVAAANAMVPWSFGRSSTAPALAAVMALTRVFSAPTVTVS